MLFAAFVILYTFSLIAFVILYDAENDKEETTKEGKKVFSDW